MSDSAMRAYLLGQATDVEAAQLEARLLDDEAVLETLRSVEDDLFDQHARGALTADERVRFTERYGAERGRLLFAHALAGRRARTRVLPFRPVQRRHWMAAAAAAALVAAVGATVWIRGRSVSGAPALARTTPPQPAPGQPLAQPSPATAPQPALNPAILLVTVGTRRTAAAPFEATLTAGTPGLELHVRLHPEDRFDRYTMTLLDNSDRPIWFDQNARLSTDAGERILVALVPANLLEAGTYVLAVRGLNAGSQPEAIAFVSVSIRR